MCDVYSTDVRSTIAVDILRYWGKILLPFIPGSQVVVAVAVAVAAAQVA